MTVPVLRRSLTAAILLAGAVWAQAVRFDVGNLDRGASPCADFYQYACGTWIENNPVPADQARLDRFAELAERNRQTLRAILEGAGQSQIGDYYAACIDTAAIDRKGLAPLQAELDRIAALRNKTELAPLVARLHRFGADVVFGFGSGQDFKDSSQVIAQADQAGLGLPDRDYYLKTDARSVELRGKYQGHVERMFALAGYAPAPARRAAAAVMRLETALARASLDLVSRRDPEKVYHKLTTADLEKLAPAFAWRRYLADTGAAPLGAINVAVPDFFKGLDKLLRATPLDQWKHYLTWQALHAAAIMLPAKFIDETFDFYGRTLTGAKQLRPRWKRCVDSTDNHLGEALGRQFVERTFGADGKQRTLRMVDALEKALGRDLDTLAWMTPETRRQARVKLAAIRNKIGYPDRWRDYSAVTVAPGDALGNLFRTSEFEFARQLAKIGKPLDRGEWGMSPPTVNAYYDPLMNDINFPAGILQPPFFDKEMDDAVNFGAIGAVIGHELTHGFDDQGRQFDAQGNMRDWWTPADAKEFERRAACLVEEYSKFEVAPGAPINGKLTLGENTADNGGVRIALMALEDVLSGRPQPAADGFSPQQRLFLGFAQVWCSNATEESRRLQASVDPHSDARFRVNGTVQNMPEFQRAFACQAGQPMVSPKPCRVW